jgi:hypothetical protein
VKACSVWIGFDPREAQAFAVCRWSIEHFRTTQVPIRGIVLSDLQERGLYTRPVEHDEEGRLWDPISEWTMSTEFAISRFFTPYLANEKKKRNGFSDVEYEDWALFMDCDILARGSLFPIFDLGMSHYAVMVVKHEHNPDYGVKMDGQIQSKYHRKNWSSVMLFNCNHPSNKKLTLEMLNTLPGRDLHRFCWLEDHEIGELPPVWNYLVGHTELKEKEEPRLVHFTDGIPSMRGYENCEYADEYRRALELWASR